MVRALFLFSSNYRYLARLDTDQITEQYAGKLEVVEVACK